MAGTAQGTITRLLGELEAGDRSVLDTLLPLVYQELLRLAHRQRLRWQGDDTLGTTALVHEAYLRLVATDRVAVESRAHFFALASTAMRRILCNYARDQRAQKRGGDLRRVPAAIAGEAAAPEAAAPEAELTDDQIDRLAALDEALRRLAEVDVRRSRVVECRFFGGMSVDDTATALGISPRTVKRDWAVAQAWLSREVGAGAGATGG